MVLYCVVPECKNNSRTPGISLHRFPTNERKKKAWLMRMRRHGKVSTAMRVCSAHFLPEDYRYISSFRKCLKEGAEPSMFPYDTSRESEAPLGFLLSVPKSKKNIQAWKPQEKIIAPPLEDFLELPLKYTSNKKKKNRFFLKEEIATTLFPTKVKNTQESANYVSSIKKEIDGILGYDPKTWKWLKRSKKTKKTFINYFSSGMSPSVAIQHHESMLCFENPDLLNDSKRNPPRAWVYSLYESWLNESEENASTESKNDSSRISDDNFFLNSTALIKISGMNKAESPVQQKDPQAPCIIHMNNKLTDDYEDLRHLLIPDEVKELFYNYFNDGLNVYEAMKLNDDNLKRNRDWPQFNPSERVVNYIYKIWHQQIKSCDDSSRDSGFISSNEKNYRVYNSSLEHTDCENIIDNVNIASKLPSNPDFEESVIVVSQAEMNSSSSMEVLPFPLLPPKSSSNPSILLENNNAASEVVKDPSQTKEKFCEKKPILSEVDYIFDPMQNQFIAISSENSVAQVNSTPVLVNSFNIKTDYFTSNKLSGTFVKKETDMFNSPKNLTGLFYEKISEGSSFNSNRPCYFSGSPNNYPFQTLSESTRPSCQTTFSDSFNEHKISNHSESSIMKDSSNFHSTRIYDSNICFQLNSETDENEHHTFHAFEDKDSESISSMTCEIMKLSQIYSTSQLNPQENTFLLNSPNLIKGYNMVKEIPDDVISISSSKEENRECINISGTENFKIAPLELAKQNEDQKFLMSLLPEFECIPDSFKFILKSEIVNLVHSTKLRANKGKTYEIL